MADKRGGIWRDFWRTIYLESWDWSPLSERGHVMRISYYFGVHCDLKFTLR